MEVLEVTKRESEQELSWGLQLVKTGLFFRMRK